MLDMGPGRHRSTSALTDSAQHLPRSTRHNIGPNRLGLTLSRSESARHGLRPTLLDIDPFDSARHRP